MRLPLQVQNADDRGQPIGEITNWEQIQFPFDPHHAASHDLSTVSAERISANGNMLAREGYTCDANGNLRVRFPHFQPATSVNIRSFSLPRNDNPTHAGQIRSIAVAKNPRGGFIHPSEMCSTRDFARYVMYPTFKREDPKLEMSRRL